MKLKRSKLSECEEIVMKCIWDAGDSVTCQQIMTQLEQKYDLHYKSTTVYTFLKNLKKKGFVDTYRNGVTFYKPDRTEEEYRKEVLERTSSLWFNNSPLKYVSALVDVQEISEEERDRLKRLIEELDD